MDVLSHGLWGSIGFGQQNKNRFWESFLFGIMPDFLSYGIFFIMLMSGISQDLDWESSSGQVAFIPQYVSTLYTITHSLVVFSFVFIVLWFIYKEPVYPAMAWGLHIIMDIFTHADGFFPTPFLWPLLDFRISGVTWSEPSIFIPNLVLISIFYVWFFMINKKKGEKPIE